MKKAITLILLVALAAQTVSCGGEAAQNSGTSAADTTTAAPGDVSTEYTPAELEAKDYGGADFNVLTFKTGGYGFNTNDIGAEEENGEPLNDEIYKRNSRVMDKYNLKINAITPGDVSDVRRAAEQDVTAGEGQYDLVIDGLAFNIALAVQGMVHDLDDIEHIDFGGDHWNERMNAELELGGKRYAAVGDMNMQAVYCSGSYYFNKQLAEDYKLEDPYQLVRDGKWTIDKAAELARNVYKDLNGNNTFDEADQYGLTYNNFAWQILFYGTGEKFVKADEDGNLCFDKSNTRAVDVLQKIIPMSHDPEVVLYSENYKHIGGNYRVNVCQNAFNEGRALFWLDAMYGVPTLREMEMDFGILPSPKYDEDQEEYASFAHAGSASCVSIPVTVKDTDRAGRIVEELMRDSDAVKNAFIETTLKGKYARDNDSADMIELIMDSITTDYALSLNQSGLSIDSNIRSLMNAGDTNIMSFFESNYNAYQGTLDNINKKVNG